jgi:hypothetical protein
MSRSSRDREFSIHRGRRRPSLDDVEAAQTALLEALSEGDAERASQARQRLAQLGQRTVRAERR